MTGQAAICSLPTYRLDANGNRVALASNGGTESYTLDALNRLTNATYPNGDTAAYSYDGNGNCLSQTFNGVTTNYSYDDADNYSLTVRPPMAMTPTVI